MKGMIVMTFEQNFEKLKELFIQYDVSDYKGKLAYQFNIKGEGEGTFYAEVKDGVMSVEPFDYNDRDAMFTATYDVFHSVASGESDPVKLFFIGKLKVEGSIEKALEIQKIIKR